MAPHIVYEWQMLHATAAETPNLPVDLRNALLESFLVHARQLVDFFCGSGQNKPDDYYASDYCPSGWTNPPVSGLLDDARTAVNKYVGHLTGARLTAPARTWDVRGIVAALHELAKRFGTAADPDLFPELHQLDSEPYAAVQVMGATNTCGMPTFDFIRTTK